MLRKILIMEEDKKVAVKNDQDKPIMALLPPDSLEEIAKVFTYGAHKYSEWNWAAGFKWSRIYSALLRHLNAFWKGEDFDEVGNHHLACAGCNVMMLLSHALRNIGEDDRLKIVDKSDSIESDYKNLLPIGARIVPQNIPIIETIQVKIMKDSTNSEMLKFDVDVSCEKLRDSLYAYTFMHKGCNTQIVLYSDCLLGKNQLTPIITMVQKKSLTNHSSNIGIIKVICNEYTVLM